MLRFANFGSKWYAVELDESEKEDEMDQILEFADEGNMIIVCEASVFEDKIGEEYKFVEREK